MNLESFTLAIVLYQLGLWLIGFLLLWRIPKCRAVSTLCPKPGPSISVIIPARNEEHNLPVLLQSLDAQDQRPAEIIVVDDSSQDGTAEAARLLGARLLPAEEKPPDWVGKPWACWKGAQAATGDILVFLDADTVLSKSGLAAIAATLAVEEGLVSVQPFHTIRTPGEALSAYFNVVSMAALNVFSPLGDRLRPAGSFGPCIAVRRAEYFAAGGHEAVKCEIAEDMALGRVFQDRGVRVSCLGGKGSVSFRMYPGGLRDIAEGWTKNFALGSARTRPLFLALVVAWIAGSSTCFLSLLATLAPGFRPLWPVQAVLYLLYAAQLFWMLRRIGSFGPLAALLFPLPLLFFHGIFFRSMFLTRARNRVTWRGGGPFPQDAESSRAMGELPAAWVVLLDSLAWLVIHLAAAALTSRLPLSRFDPGGWLFRLRGWERGGEAYQRLFRVRSWKGLLPDGAALFKSGFRKKRMISRSPDYSRLFIKETCRAELMHWLVFALAPLFYLWNEWRVATLMIPYAVLVNVPCIIAQRYNRPRLTRMLRASPTRQHNL